MPIILKNGSKIFLRQRLDSRISLEMPRKFRFFAHAFLIRKAAPSGCGCGKPASQGESVGTFRDRAMTSQWERWSTKIRPHQRHDQ
jgi:hypothetical protein